MDTSSFFKKLDQENKSDLERKTGLSRQTVVNAVKTKNVKLVTLKSLAQAMNLEVSLSPVKTEELVLANLKNYGAPVNSERSDLLSFEETVSSALKPSRQNGLYESVLPYVLASNAEKFNPAILMSLAVLEDEAAVLGYFTSMANAYRPNENLRKLEALLSQFKFPVPTTLLLGQRVNFPEQFQKNKHAMKWNVLARGDFKDHLERWNKWQAQQR